MKNALLFSLGLLVIMSVALLMTPTYVLTGGRYAASGYEKCTVSTHCTDGNPCTLDVCKSGVCSNPKYTGNAAGCSVNQNGMACFEGKCQIA